MSDLPLPRAPAPALAFDTLAGPGWSLAQARPETFTLVLFYRGLHCPKCKDQLLDAQSRLDDFASRGVDVVAVSMDSEERARQAADDWGLDRLSIGYGLTETNARDWGLYMSSARNEKEPDRFNEPGLFLVRTDGTLYMAAIQSMPFARPPLDQLLSAIDFVTKNDYPARGELAA